MEQLAVWMYKNSVSKIQLHTYTSCEDFEKRILRSQLFHQETKIGVLHTVFCFLLCSGYESLITKFPYIHSIVIRLFSCWGISDSVATYIANFMEDTTVH